MYNLNLETASWKQLYERACARMAQLVPGWSDAIPSDPAAALLELTSYLSTVQNREINTLRESHYLAYLNLIGGAPRQLAPARLPAVPVRGGPPWPGLRFEIDGVPFEVTDVPSRECQAREASAAPRPVTLEQRRTRSQSLPLQAPYRLPRGWEGNLLLRFFLPHGGGWREDRALFVRDGQVRGFSGEEPREIRVVASEPDFQALYTLRELPGEEVCLDEEGVLPGSLRLMTEEDGIWYDCPVRRPEDGRTLSRGCRWEGARGALRFGDGRDFRVPQGGRLLVAGCACTLGAGGNGAGGPLEQEGITLLPLRPAAGGQDAEDGKSAFFRTAKEQEFPARAVSLSDYETLARRAPGLALDRVKALPAAQLGKTGAGVVVVAKPRSKTPLPPLTDWQRERLTGWLEGFRLIGIPIEVRGPRYCPVAVRARVRTGGPAAEQSLRAAAVQFTDGVTGPLDFGAELSYTALFSALSAVPGVKTVLELELLPLSGAGRRTREGGIRLDGDTLPYLDSFQLMEE